MKVFVYKRKTKKEHKRERVEVFENVESVDETNDNFILLSRGDIMELDKSEFIISVFGW